MSVRRAQQEVDSREFSEWLAYDRLDPIGGERLDLNTALIVSAIMNSNRSKGPSIKPSEVMLDFTKSARRPSADEIRHKMLAAIGHRIVRSKD